MLLTGFTEEERLQKGEGLGQTVSVSQAGKDKCIPARDMFDLDFPLVFYVEDRSTLKDN